MLCGLSPVLTAQPIDAGEELEVVCDQMGSLAFVRFLLGITGETINEAPDL